MVYVTTSRVPQGTLLPWSELDWSSGVTTRGSIVSPESLSQTTTSFRTGRGFPAPEDVVDAPLTEAGVFHYLKDIARESGDNITRPGDNGHTFSTQRTMVGHMSHKNLYLGYYANGTTLKVYRGPLFCVPTGTGNDFPSASLDGFSYDSTIYGTKALAACSPLNPASQIGEILGQSAQGAELPSLTIHFLESGLRKFAALGNDFLNYEFGWRPFLKDFHDSLSFMKKTTKAIRQLRRDSDKPIRRAFSFDVVTSGAKRTNPEPVLFAPGATNSSLTLLSGIGESSQINTHSVYFKGAFMYHLPSGDDFWSRLERYEFLADQATGVGASPSVLYALTPWSWLANWFSDLNSFMRNLTHLGSDGLVIKYGYIMHHTIRDITHACPNVRTQQGLSLGTVQNTFRFEAKERAQATPYGFGLSIGSFSDTQWAILGALGLTRAPKILHAV